MIYEHGTIVVTAAVALVIRKIAQMLDRSETDGMFVVGLSATGNLPATHFISSGQVPSVFMRAIESPVTLRSKAIEAYALEGVTMPYTLSLVTTVLMGCKISNGKTTVLIDLVPTVVDEGPHEFIARLGLKLIQGPM